jgi:hypothetical protein
MRTESNWDAIILMTRGNSKLYTPVCEKAYPHIILPIHTGCSFEQDMLTQS